MHRSPLRYPGGKSKLTPFIDLVMNRSRSNKIYVEPFAGGAGIALDLLLSDKVESIVINDLDKSVYSFWKAILTEKNKFIETMHYTEVSIEERERQKQVLLSSKKYSFELGFAMFYLNRTNRSGIISAGPIGGKHQNGNWKIDARFNKIELEKRINAINERKKDIKIYNKDVGTFITKYLSKYGDDAFVYFDPPYYNKGKQLYMNYFDINDHVRIEQSISENVTANWIVTYDDTPKIEEIYKNYKPHRFDINYSVANKIKASELMFFKDDWMCPTKKELEEMKIKINLR